MAKHRIEVKLVRDGQQAVMRTAEARRKRTRDSLTATVAELKTGLKAVSALIRKKDLKGALFILHGNLSEATQRVMEAAYPLGICRGAEVTVAMMENAVFEGNRKQSSKEERK